MTNFFRLEYTFEESEQYLNRRYLLLHNILIIATIIQGLLSLLHFFTTGIIYLGVIELVFTVGYFLLFLYLKKDKKHFDLTFKLALAILTLTIVLTSFASIDNGSRLIWFAVPIIFTYFLKGKVAGLYYTLGSLIYIIIYALQPLGETYLNSITFIGSIVTIITIALLTHYYETTIQEFSHQQSVINSNLQDLVNEKTAELKAINQDLEKKILEQQDHLIINERHAAMGEMISMIAHQWRQPISTVSNIATTIMIRIEKDQCEPKILYKDMEQLTELTAYLSNTIEDFKEFFKPHKESQLIPLKTLIENSLSLFRPVVEASGITVINEVQSDEEIEVYKNELIQVLINLLKNAHDQFDTHPQKEMTIKLREVIYNDSFQLLIEDNAGGIDPAILSQIFEPYYSTKGDNGTGLGLYMSKIIVQDNMQGSIKAYNNTMGGATFALTLNKRLHTHE
jgi:signal transduction histidine kinase